MQQWESEPIKNQPWSAITIIFGRFEEYGMESNGMEDMRAREKEEKIEDDITGLLESPRRSSIECLAASFHRAVGESEGDGERSSHC
jgi:hypothetical protein